ncbi:hypothetical protein CVT26_013802 [Gymnopilus dilepis]|uniref:Uncharacterized protein n=1 Tax=Gymnopilus dilepis TaxID=231916 RepID=A0A409WST2_9AGAR|nr:hypothetical protein CVT26_013802 [Gymnopilus dilepis]
MRTFYFSTFSVAPLGAESSAADIQAQNPGAEPRLFRSYQAFEKALLREEVEQAVITVRSKRRQGKARPVRRLRNRLRGGI